MSSEDENTFDSIKVENLIAMAEYRAEQAERARDEARAELSEVKRNIGWMMGKALISDVILRSDSVPASDAPYEMLPEPEDTARLAWINSHGRVCMGSESFTVAFDHGGGQIGSATLPTPYNIRHLIDLCRKNVAGSI